MKHKHLLFLVLSLTLSLQALRAESLPEALLDTWVLRLKFQSWLNGQFRYRVLSFWKQGQEDVAYLDFTIYPSSDVRSILLMGKAWREANNTLALQQQKQIRILHEGKGFPTPFSREQQEVTARRRQKFRLDNGGQVLQLDGQTTFANYGKSWEAARKQNNIVAGMDLFAILIYLMQSKVPYFGSVKMMENRDTLAHGVSGQLLLNFEKRGLLGLGNSGLWFELTNFQPLARSRLNGRYFAGLKSMEGALQIKIHGKPIFGVEFSEVEIKNGYASRGFFEARFLSSQSSTLAQAVTQKIPVGRYGH